MSRSDFKIHNQLKISANAKDAIKIYFLMY